MFFLYLFVSSKYIYIYPHQALREAPPLGRHLAAPPARKHKNTKLTRKTQKNKNKT